jgi:hypothetical protein
MSHARCYFRQWGTCVAIFGLPLPNFELIRGPKPGELDTSTLLDPENLPEACTADAH